MILSTVLMTLGFVLLIKGADFLVSGSCAIARRFNVSDLVIGLTVVAFGTSSPELSVSIISGLNGSTDIAVGNVLGSNICNILLILGVSSIICPLSISKGTVSKEIPLSLLAAVVLFLMANDSVIDHMPPSMLTRSDGLVLLCFFSIFLYYTFSIATDINGLDTETPNDEYTMPVSILYVLLGLSGLTLGGKWIVDGAVNLALKMGMTENLVGLTIVAVGTSLPELATSAMAAFRKKADIAVGNVIGSNIFNIFLILGISASITPLPFREANNEDIAVLLVSSLFLFLFWFTFKKSILDRREGVFFVLSYVAYLTYIVFRG